MRTYYRNALIQCDFDISYLRFIECYEDKNTTIRLSVRNNISSFVAIVLVNGNIIAIYELWK